MVFPVALHNNDKVTPFLPKMTVQPFIPFCINVGGRLVEFSRPAVMGILNVTSDSFYDGGRHLSEPDMVEHARWLLEQGADILDVGVVSSRPGAQLPPPDIEAHRLASAVARLRKELPNAIISVDTCFALPARKAIESGANMVNDIGGGLLDPDMFATVSLLQVPYILMHNRGIPTIMQQLTDYDDVVDDMVHFFSRRLDQLYRLGVKDVWIDPGFGFAKTLEQNHLLLHRLDELTTLFREPLLAALSRKSMIYKPLGISPDEALPGTVALDTMALERGARILRVHDPREARQTIDLIFGSHINPKSQKSHAQ